MLPCLTNEIRLMCEELCKHSKDFEIVNETEFEIRKVSSESHWVKSCWISWPVFNLSILSDGELNWLLIVIKSSESNDWRVGCMIGRRYCILPRHFGLMSNKDSWAVIVLVGKVHCRILLIRILSRRTNWLMILRLHTKWFPILLANSVMIKLETETGEIVGLEILNCCQVVVLGRNNLLLKWIELNWFDLSFPIESR